MNEIDVETFEREKVAQQLMYIHDRHYTPLSGEHRLIDSKIEEMMMHDGEELNRISELVCRMGVYLYHEYLKRMYGEGSDEFQRAALLYYAWRKEAGFGGANELEDTSQDTKDSWVRIAKMVCEEAEVPRG